MHGCQALGSPCARAPMYDVTIPRGELLPRCGVCFEAVFFRHPPSLLACIELTSQVGDLTLSRVVSGLLPLAACCRENGAETCNGHGTSQDSLITVLVARARIALVGLVATFPCAWPFFTFMEFVKWSILQASLRKALGSRRVMDLEDESSMAFCAGRRPWRGRLGPSLLQRGVRAFADLSVEVGPGLHIRKNIQLFEITMHFITAHRGRGILLGDLIFVLSGESHMSWT